MYFDGAVNQYGNGIGVLLITPDKSHIPMAVKLNFGHSTSSKVVEGERGTPKVLPTILGGVDKDL